MRVKLENFRAFRETESIKVHPINLLVGENSSGKTSFSAALKFLFDIFSGESAASFNSEPFFLGSFRDITHLRGGRAGRAKSFSFSITLPVAARSSVRVDIADLFPDQPPHDATDVVMKLNFAELKAQASLSNLTVYYGENRLDFEFQKGTMIVSDESGESISTRVPIRISRNEFVFDFSYFHFVLREFHFLERRRKEQITEAQERIVQKIENLSIVINRATREVSRATIATAPVRTEPQRVYQITERETQRTGNQAAYDLAQLKAFEAKEWTETKKGLEEFGRNTGLFRQINVRHLNANKDGPFQIELKVGKQTSNIIDVGYGVSQALPLVFDLLRAKNPSVFFIQQPEIHLHPKAQVEIASMISEVAKRGNHIIFIETHSDFIIDRIRADVRDKDYLTGEDVGILFFRRKDLEAEISQIGINKKGEMTNVPSDYRSFFLKEKMKSMGV